MDVFAVLADPTRRQILDLLADHEQSVGELVNAFPISQPAVSRHLRVLRETGLVRVRGAGQRRIYRLEAKRLTEVDAWLDRYRRFWEERFDRLEVEIERVGRQEAEERPAE